jgi:hypothetical protein
MGRRQDLNEILVSLFKGIVDPNSYKYIQPCVKYQPGSSITLTYPAIVYKLDDIPSIYANNRPYLWSHRYELQVIDRDPESKLRERVVGLPMCKFSNSFVSDNLYHYVFEIFY